MKTATPDFRNSTFVVLVKGQNGRITIKQLDERHTPIDPDSGVNVFGPMVRRLMNVREIVAKTGQGVNEARRARREQPHKFLVHALTPVLLPEHEKAA